MMPKQGRTEGLPSIRGPPPKPPPRPMGDLSCLPDALLPILCALLPARDICRLGGASRALYRSPYCFPSRLALCQRPGLELTTSKKEDEVERLLCMTSMLSVLRRGARTLQELRVTDPWLVEPFCVALRSLGSPMGQLTSLHVTLVDLDYSSMTDRRLSWCDRPVVVITDGGEERLAQVLAAGLLPELRELHLHSLAGEVSLSMARVWRALGQGACPRLEVVGITGCCSLQADELFEALRARWVQAGRGLKALSLDLSTSSQPAGQPPHQPLQGHPAFGATLSRLPSCRLESLRVTGGQGLPRSVGDALAIAMPLLNLTNLHTLVLGVHHHMRFGHQHSDALLRALAACDAPCLTHLDLSNWGSSEEACEALGGAECLRRVRTLRLHNAMQDTRHLTALCRAIADGHGCPHLESLSLGCGWLSRDCGASLAPAFLPPTGLPRLKRLELSSASLRDMDALLSALRDRPHALSAMGEVLLRDCRFGSRDSFNQALLPGGPLADVTLLHATEVGVEGDKLARGIVQALARGGGQRLERLEWSTEHPGVSVFNSLLHALTHAAACPRLRRLSSPRPRRAYTLVRHDRFHAMALSQVLRGEAACSASLIELDLETLVVGNYELRAMADALGSPQAIQLEALRLSVNPEASEGVMVLLTSLGGRAGARLGLLDIAMTCKPSKLCHSGPVDPRTTKHVEGVVLQLANHLSAIMDAGGLPAMGASSERNEVLLRLRCVAEGGHSALQEEEGMVDAVVKVLDGAMQRRRRARWMAGH